MENFEIVLKLTVAEVNIVLAGIGKLPIETGISVFQNVKNQAETQIQSAQSNTAPVADTESESD